MSSTPYALPGAALHVLPPGATGRAHQLYVFVPASAAAAPERRYPVVYLTDPQWDFGLVQATAGNLSHDGAIPECLVVGVGYPGEGLDYEALRVGDLAPTPDPHLDAPGGQGGGAERFLEALEREVIPFVERSYPADPASRVLLGSSLGGLFALYALLTRPALFGGYVAASPAVIWGQDWILALEERRAAELRGLRARLFMSGAGEEWPEFLAGVLRFDARLRVRAHPGLAYQWRLVEGERHSGTKAESFTRGLRWAFGG